MESARKSCSYSTTRASSWERVMGPNERTPRALSSTARSRPRSEPIRKATGWGHSSLRRASRAANCSEESVSPRLSRAKAQADGGRAARSAAPSAFSRCGSSGAARARTGTSRTVARRAMRLRYEAQISSQLERWWRPAQTTTSSRATSGGASPYRRVVEVLRRAAHEVLLPLVEVGESLEVAHAVEEDDAVQVVVLVLDDARLEAQDHVVERTPVAVEPLHPHLGMARHQAPQVGDREAPLPVVRHLAGLGGDQGVDHHVQRDLRRARRLVDEDLQLLAHLGRGETHAMRGVHRLHHAVDQTLDLGPREQGRRQRLRRGAQRGVTEADDG